MSTKIHNLKFLKVANNIFYWAKTLNNTKFEIIGSKGFKSAFINKNKTLNKHFNSAVFELRLF